MAALAECQVMGSAPRQGAGASNLKGGCHSGTACSRETHCACCCSHHMACSAIVADLLPKRQLAESDAQERVHNILYSRHQLQDSACQPSQQLTICFTDQRVLMSICNQSHHPFTSRSMCHVKLPARPPPSPCCQLLCRLRSTADASLCQTSGTHCCAADSRATVQLPGLLLTATLLHSCHW